MTTKFLCSISTFFNSKNTFSILSQKIKIFLRLMGCKGFFPLSEDLRRNFSQKRKLSPINNIPKT